MKICAFYDYGYYDRECHVVASLLSVNETFLSTLEKIRFEISLKNYFEVPEEPSIEALYGLVSKLGKEKKEKLQRLSAESIDTFNLPSNWEFSVMVLVITDVFFIPSEYSVINLHIPPEWLRVGEKLENSKIKESKNTSTLLPWKKVEQYPAIYFTGQVSVKEIKSWLDKYGKELRTHTDKLPYIKKTKIRDKTMFWGYVVHMVKKSHPNYSWSKVVEETQNFIDSYFDENGDIIEDVDDEMKEWLQEAYEGDVASEELNNFYSSYMRTANRN